MTQYNTLRLLVLISDACLAAEQNNKRHDFGVYIYVLLLQ